jgi:hypothetical protein
MKDLLLETKVVVCTPDEMDPSMRMLVEKAKEMTQNAYCPYSK